MWGDPRNVPDTDRRVARGQPLEGIARTRLLSGIQDGALRPAFVLGSGGRPRGSPVGGSACAPAGAMGRHDGLRELDADAALRAGRAPATAGSAAGAHATIVPVPRSAGALPQAAVADGGAAGTEGPADLSRATPRTALVADAQPGHDALSRGDSHPETGADAGPRPGGRLAPVGGAWQPPRRASPAERRILAPVRPAARRDRRRRGGGGHARAAACAGQRQRSP